VFFWIPAYAGMTTLRYLTAGVINNKLLVKLHEMFGLARIFRKPDRLWRKAFQPAGGKVTDIPISGQRTNTANPVTIIKMILAGMP